MDKDIKEILEILICRVLRYENCTGDFDNVDCEECYDYYDCNLANELLSKLKNK